LVEYRIVNVVATASLDEKVDLEKLGRAKGVVYDQDIYGGRVAYLRLPEMKGTVSVFFSGKMISIGTKSEEHAFRDLQHARDFLIEKNLVRSVELFPKVQNIVATADLGGAVDLEKLVCMRSIIYEPEQFPGAILKINKPHKATVLIFASGKIVIAGLKDSHQIDPVLSIVLRTVGKNPMDKSLNLMCGV